MEAVKQGRRVELLAPAGDEAMMRAAVENGADAIYFGLEALNARARAANFRAEDLPRIMAWLHERGVRGYITLNTLVFCSEMEEAAEALRACSAAGVDAVLIQDLGLARLAAELTPDLPVHASTQMTLTCADSILAARELGLPIERVVAAREMTRRELGKTLREVDCEIEVFIHGAICVAYSGQCLTSEALGGRSANRGECAQACRLPYDLIVDGETRPMGDVKYLLSPRDLMGFGEVAGLAEIGVVSLKIEGRLKSPEYVAATTQVYRKAIDEAMARTELKEPEIAAGELRKLEMTFSRGFTSGYLHEINHQNVVEGRFPKKRGMYLGMVEKVGDMGGAATALIRLEAPLKPGDGVVFDAGRPDEPEQGGRVYGLRIKGRALERFDPAEDGAADVTVIFGREAGPNRERIHVGDRLWKTSDPELDAELRRSFAGDQPKRKRPVWARVTGAAGEPLRMELRDEAGRVARVEDTEPAQAALRKPLTEEILRDQLDRIGDTPFELAGVEVEIEGAVMVPFSRLNQMRRRAVELLIEASHERVARRYDPAALGRLRNLEISIQGSTPGAGRRPAPQPGALIEPTLGVLCRTLEQVGAALGVEGIDAIITDFESPRGYAEAREMIPRRAGAPAHIIATMRVQKPGEEPLARKLVEIEADGYLVRNLGVWRVMREELRGRRVQIIGDYSLNVANDITARLLIEAGFDRLTPSYDLNIDQLLDLLRATPPHWHEITIHQRIPMFHMEHCVFCRFMSDGTDHTNCGRPCESHRVSLRDRMGFDHEIKADAGCRNTVYNAVAQSASEYLDAMLAAGARRFRVELLSESADETRRALTSYLDALRGRTDGSRLWRRLNAASKLGVTRGSLDHGL